MRPNSPDEQPSGHSLSIAAAAQNRFIRGRLWLAGIGLIVPLVGFFFAPHAESGPIVCASRGVLGIPCPGCGLTRGVSAAVRLHWIDACRYHPLAVPAALAFLAVGMTALVELSVGRRFPWYRRYLSATAIWSLFVVLVLIHAVRLFIWHHDGTLQRDYWQRGWLYHQLHRPFDSHSAQEFSDRPVE